MDYKKPRGMIDWYGSKMQLYQYFRNQLENLSQMYHFQALESPTLEFQQLFNRSVGNETDIVQKEMFIVTDKKNRSLVLKPEGTAPAVRLILENKLLQTGILPLKFYYISDMYRYERPQAGRFRQFHQYGIEIIGPLNPLLEAECLLFANQILQHFSINNYVIKINYLGSLATQEKYIEILVKVCSSLSLCSDCARRIKINPLRILDCKIDHNQFDKLPKLHDFWNDIEQDNFKQIQIFLNNMKVKYELDLLLVRGFDYYTGLVYEFVQTENHNNTLIAGGTYANLIKSLDPKLNYPGCGFGLGIERLMMMKDKWIIPNAKLDFYLLGINLKAADDVMAAYQIIKQLRKHNFKVDFDFSPRPLKQKFKKSDAYQPAYIGFVGPDELKQQTIKFKAFKQKELTSIKLDQLISTLQSILFKSKCRTEEILNVGL